MSMKNYSIFNLIQFFKTIELIGKISMWKGMEKKVVFDNQLYDGLENDKKMNLRPALP